MGKFSNNSNDDYANANNPNNDRYWDNADHNSNLHNPNSKEYEDDRINHENQISRNDSFDFDDD